MLIDKSDLIGGFKISCPSQTWAEGREFIKRIRLQIDIQGFAVIPGKTMRQLLGALSTDALLAAALNAPHDPYDKSGLRFRRYHSGTFQPWSGRTTFDDPFVGVMGDEVTRYQQGGAYNPEFPDLARYFAPFPDQILNDSAFLEFISTLSWMLPGERFKRDQRQQVGVHLTNLVPGLTAAISPPHMIHCDGEPFTVISLLSRRNVGGGISYVTTRDCVGLHPDDIEDRSKILARLELTELMDTIIVADDRVAHHVTSVFATSGDSGYRAVLLIDFSELRPGRAI